MYPSTIQEYILQNLQGRKVSRKTRGGYSHEYISFRNFCLSQNIDIESIFSTDLSFMEIIYCISKGTGPTICNCGKVVNESAKGRKWCSIQCRSNDKSYCNTISEIKSKLYNDPKWKEKVEFKKISTTLERFGVKYPMQNISSFEKQQAACFEKDENGHHGYEPYVYPFLFQIYPLIQNGTNYLKENNLIIEWDGNDGKKHRSYPDFFSEEINSFIEVKSDYTRKLHENKLMKCKDELFNMKYGYIICIVNPRKEFIFKLYNHFYITDE